MPRRKLARRFEPRYGVNQTMLDVECKWVQCELEDHLLLSLNDSREKLAEVHRLVAGAETTLADGLNLLPDRERLALKGMLVRDVYHIAMLYDTFLRTMKLADDATGPIHQTPEESDASGQHRLVLGFKTFLFE